VVIVIAGPVTVNKTVPDPTPFVLTTEIGNWPAAASSAAGTVALIWFELRKLVASG
jgi:hypothetical protein